MRCLDCRFYREDDLEVNDFGICILTFMVVDKTFEAECVKIEDYCLDADRFANCT